MTASHRLHRINYVNFMKTFSIINTGASEVAVQLLSYWPRRGQLRAP